MPAPSKCRFEIALSDGTIDESFAISALSNFLDARDAHMAAHGQNGAGLGRPHQVDGLARGSAPPKIVRWGDTNEKVRLRTKTLLISKSS
jgi:hypothetical protein